ncbi:uncharacterized protein [Anabrus simplex]|uniref:uncharacterized protein isoform X2 n=1 Tax=Anabrus simplex TaxID=316456 RepID=UPI0035A35364
MMAENRSTRRKTCPASALSSTNLTWSDRHLNHVPCSVITSHGEPTETQPYSGSTATVVLDPVTYTVPMEEARAIPSIREEVAVFDLVNMKIWPERVHEAEVILESDCHPLARKRKRKRPYSPVIPVTSKKLVDRRKNAKRLKRNNHAEALQHNTIKPFSCDRCKSPYVVNPARVHVPNSRQINHRPRKAIDPITKKILLLCNACGLALSRPKKQKEKKVPPSDEAKQKYIEESIKFAAKLAESLQEPEADRLFCPSFKTKPCQCLQNYVTDKDEGESRKRATFLLTLLKDAKNLSKQKNNVKNAQELPDELNSTSQVINKAPPQRGLMRCRSQLYEDFVLTKRRYLRNDLRFCERACQKILMYSNNFLHKHLKSSPDKSPRIQKVSGKKSRSLLKPISELANETCCNDKCVLLALTHSKLLESWRMSARLGQREARRVLAEMLTPSGGTKANCYKFISMVTGCSHTTICLVNEQMRQTQGDREPPEHGLKQWWRLHGKERSHQSKSDKQYQNDNSVDEESLGDFPDIYIPSDTELQLLDPKEASRQLENQRQKLLQLKKKLDRQQLLLEQQQQKLQLTQEPSQSQDPKTNLGSAPNMNSQQLLHIVEIPSSTSSVITNVPESTHTQPAISVMTASGSFEPLASISVSLASSGQTFSNVVILPDSVLENPVLNHESISSGSQQNFSCTSNNLESESGQTAQSQPSPEFNLVPAVFSAGNKECCDLPRLYYLDT